ncbi:MAG: hypothetical protein GWM92_19190 [Gemmatimonadetes bacterium]|nr:hypothetical protein [Gemmatimonadota bacterium]NIR80929.1 hypothetical protein [Gemmatimonadota bacterium]NIT89747.1 hypothetical protein [Gemmatimonadota bacterium]NIU33533.1 hypothetical protein [Gemmatimonadota bacterium]NIU37803.1 hypothetical protein [Gemmatimonadota bacterium]
MIDPASTPRGGWIAVGLVVAGAAVAGCFSEHTSPVEPGEELTCADVPPEGRTGADPVVVIRDFAFHPEELTVSPGTTVSWINCEDPGGAAHTTTSDTGLWDSGLLGAGGAEVFRRTFQEEGAFDYHCTPHPFMQARVGVES